jgi:hypothetical protein
MPKQPKKKGGSEDGQDRLKNRAERVREQQRVHYVNRPVQTDAQRYAERRQEVDKAIELRDRKAARERQAAEAAKAAKAAKDNDDDDDDDDEYDTCLASVEDYDTKKKYQATLDQCGVDGRGAGEQYCVINMESLPYMCERPPSNSATGGKKRKSQKKRKTNKKRKTMRKKTVKRKSRK